MGFLIVVLTAVHVIVAVFLIGLILMQKSSDQGVGAAFGGGVTDQVFGGGTTTALVRMTIWCACILLATTLLLAVLHAKHGTAPGLMRRVTQTAPAFPASPPPQLPSQPTATETPAATPAASPAPAAPAESPTTPSSEQSEKSP
jgi:preprotein translocase subunit SecG